MSFLNDFLDDITGKSAEKAAREASGIEQQKQDKAQEGRIEAGQDFSGTANTIADLFGDATPRTEVFESLAQLLGLRGTAGNEAAVARFRGIPGREFSDEQERIALLRGQEASGRNTGGGRQQLELQRQSKGQSDATVQDFIANLFGLGNQERAIGAEEGGFLANEANARLTGAQGLLGNTSSAFADRFRAPSPTGQGVTAAAAGGAAGSQNLLDTGLKIAGMFTGIPPVPTKAG